MNIADIVSLLEKQAPIALQEDYDNCGLLVGSSTWECSGVLLTVDVTPDVVQEAIDSDLNMIVAHHPLIFKGLKRLSGNSVVERSVNMAIKNDIAIYACHTSIDNALGGVSHQMAKKLALTEIKTLAPQHGKLLKLTVFVPHRHADSVSNALFAAGAGKIGNYDSCSYTSEGVGSFRACQGANPFVGGIGEIHHEPETKIEVVLPSWRRSAVIEAMLQAHPYEEPAYDIIATENTALTGCGAIGNLSEPLSASLLVEKVKTVFGSPITRCSKFDMNTPISRVAMCGGSGSFLVPNAIAQGAQAFITSDTKYHDFIDYADKILIIDIGHHESENCTKDIFYHIITEKFPIFAVRYSQSDINPIKYL